MSNNLNHYQINGLSCRGFIYLIKNMFAYPVLWNKTKRAIYRQYLMYTVVYTYNFQSLRPCAWILYGIGHRYTSGIQRKVFNVRIII